MPPRQDEIISELLRRRLATEKLVEFAKFVYPDYVDEPLHHLIAGHLDRVVSGEIKRLIVTTPPQVGKSKLVSNALPAFWLGRHPNDPIILSSYAASLAEFHSQRSRDIMDSREYKTLFPKTEIRSDTRAKEFWRIKNQNDGGLLAVGVGGGITGHPSKLGIIDDPTSNDEEARSQVVQDKIWNWYLTGYRTRIRPDGAQVICMTRWAEFDLVGRILNDSAISKEGWVILRAPALTETQEERDFNNRKLKLSTGEPDPLGRTVEESCDPIRHPTDFYRTQRAASMLTFMTLYQNAPIGIQGVVVQREMFKLVVAAPPGCVFVRYFDKAGTENGGKYTAGVLLGYQHAANGVGGNIYIVDVMRGQWSAATREPRIKETVESDRRLYGSGVQTWVEQEGGSGGKESAESTIKNLVGFAAFSETVTGDKMTRAQPFVSQLMGGNVYLVIAPWNADYIDEWVSIPNGKYLDQVDASSGALAHALVLDPAGAPAVSGERPQMAQASQRLPNLLYRGIARTGALTRYANNRYVPIAPQPSQPFGTAAPVRLFERHE